MHPILIPISGDFFIGTYGAAIAIGLLCASALAAWRGKSRGFDADIFFDFTFLAVVAGFIGARILFIALNFDGFLKAPMEYLLSRTGFVFLGGFVTALAACSWYIWKKKLDYWKVADMLVPSLALGHAFGRIGCHFAGCCYGGVCRVPWGISIPPVALSDGTLWPNAFSDQLGAGLIPPEAAHSLSIYPVQLMESVSLFALTAVLVWIGSRPQRKGFVFGLYLVCYAVIRFLLEYLRGDAERGLFLNGALSTSQGISILLFIGGVVVLATCKGREIWGPGVAVAAGISTSRRRRGTGG